MLTKSTVQEAKSPLKILRQAALGEGFNLGFKGLIGNNYLLHDSKCLKNACYPDRT
jgi:hypothetical protein